MASDTLLLAHLSDIHLAPMPRLELRHANLKRLLGTANWHRNRRRVHTRGTLDRIVADLRAQAPDHIAVTGDLVNLGLPREHAAALSWLGALGAPAQVSVVPGNHDAYVRLRADPGHRRWLGYMQGEQQVGGASGFPFLRRLGPVALIGLASGEPTPPFVSAGRLGNGQLDALARLLAECGAQSFVRVVLIHHPPYRYPQAWRTGLKDAEGLERILRQEGAELVLHGHFHRHQLRWIDRPGRPIPIAGVPSASAALAHKGDLAGYALYRISNSSEGPRIEMTRRGLAEPGGPVREIERRVLLPHQAPNHA